jgi:hypothetical protein
MASYTETINVQDLQQKTGKSGKSYFLLKDDKGRFLSFFQMPDENAPQIGESAKVEIEEKQIGDKTFYNIKRFLSVTGVDKFEQTLNGDLKNEMWERKEYRMCKTAIAKSMLEGQKTFDKDQAEEILAWVYEGDVPGIGKEDVDDIEEALTNI